MKETKQTISNRNTKVDLQPFSAAGGMAIGIDLSGKLGLLNSSGEFNGNRTVTRPGLPSVNPGGDTVGEFLNNYFFPAVPPTITAFYADNAVREFGSSTSVTLHWGVQAQTNPITRVTVVGGVRAGATGTVTTSTGPNTDTTFSMSVTTGSEVANATTEVVYRHYRFWFTSDVDLLSYEATALSDVLRQTVSKEFATSRQQSEREFALNNEYIYFCYLKAYGDASFVVGGLPNTAYQAKDFNYTNASGHTAEFRLYRSGGKGAGTIKVQIQ